MRDDVQILRSLGVLKIRWISLFLQVWNTRIALKLIEFTLKKREL